MKRRTRFALAAMFDSLMPAELRNVNIASFYPTERYIQKLVVGIEPVQSGSGDPAPDNVRYISGFTGCNVTRTGTNLLDESTVVVGSINISDGTDTSSTTMMRSDYMPVSEKGSIYVTAANTVRFFWYDTQKSYLGTTVVNNGVGATTPIAHSAFFRCISLIATWSGNVMINYGSSALSYEPYNGNTYSVSWNTEAGTVYGGMLDVTTGVLTVDRALIDLSTLSWASTTWGGYRAGAPIDAADGPIENLSAFAAEKYTSELAATVATADYTGNGIALGNSSYPLRWYVHSQDGNTPSGNLVYPLATPLTYQLTPTQIATLHPGINNVWCDTGPVIELIS